MSPTIITIEQKKLVGKRLQMSLAEDKTPELWKSFMPNRKEINLKLSNDLYALRIYKGSYDFINFDFGATFEKWATIEVAGFEMVPAEMETYTLPAGLYAVFTHKGSSADVRIFNYIFGEWLPSSIYEVDQRPHFELLSEKYKNNDPNSEETIWLPIRLKT